MCTSFRINYSEKLNFGIFQTLSFRFRKISSKEYLCGVIDRDMCIRHHTNCSVESVTERGASSPTLSSVCGLFHTGYGTNRCHGNLAEGSSKRMRTPSHVREVEKSFWLNRPDGWVVNRKTKKIILLEFKRTTDYPESYNRQRSVKEKEWFKWNPSGSSGSARTMTRRSYRDLGSHYLVITRNSSAATGDTLLAPRVVYSNWWGKAFPSVSPSLPQEGKS